MNVKVGPLDTSHSIDACFHFISMTLPYGCLIYGRGGPLFAMHPASTLEIIGPPSLLISQATSIAQRSDHEANTGIYAGDDKVIHFTRSRGQEMGTGTVLDVLLVSSAPKRSDIPCPKCSAQLADSHGVVSSCLDCFLAGGVLYRFEYAVNPALFLAKARGGTCTLAVSDPDDVVVKRANHLLANGFRCYNVFKNNCEDFAIYCKTGLLVAEQGVVGQSGQAISIVGGPLAAVFSSPLRLLTTNVYGMAVTAVGVYCASRYMTDIGKRRDVVKVEVEDLTAGLATGRVQLVEEQMSSPVAFPALPAPS